MPKCFVIQPFDNERFDKRYEDVFAPAIRDAALEPYRVDQDPSVVVPINDIQNGIASCDVCLAEISTDNPNVWFELGYAIASDRQVVLLCSDEREERYPFDVQHRSIIEYGTQSSSDFEKARSAITSRLKAVLNGEVILSQPALERSVSRTLGLDEALGLVIFAESVHDLEEDGKTVFELVRRLKKVGLSHLKASLSVQFLIDEGFLERYDFTNPFDESYTQIRLTPHGRSWLFSRSRDSISDDDIPF